MWGVEVAQVKSLPHKHEDLSDIPSTHVKNQACWYTLVTPWPGSRKQEDPWGRFVQQEMLLGKGVGGLKKNMGGPVPEA